MPTEIKPGGLAIYQKGHVHQLVRILRIFPHQQTTLQFPFTKGAEVITAETLPLIDLSALAPMKAWSAGNFVCEHPITDLTPYDIQARADLFADLRTRLRRLEEQIKVYEVTTGCDPSFQIMKWKFQDAAQRVEQEAPPGKTYTRSELICEIYRECYANAHLKCKLV